MATFTFRTNTVYNGLKFLSDIVNKTGQNTPPSGKEHGCIITEATVRQSGNDATGQAEYNCPESSKKDFEHLVRGCAKSDGNIRVDF